MKNNEEIDTQAKKTLFEIGGDVKCVCVCADFFFNRRVFKNRRAFKYSHKKESIECLLLLERTHQRRVYLQLNRVYCYHYYCYVYCYRYHCHACKKKKKKWKKNSLATRLASSCSVY